MSKQLFNVGDQIPVIKDGEDHLFEVVDISSEEGKSGTYFSYQLTLAAEVAEKAQYEKGEQVAAAENEKLEPKNPSDPAEGTE